jgi:hypothetical protein
MQMACEITDYFLQVIAFVGFIPQNQTLTPNWHDNNIGIFGRKASKKCSGPIPTITSDS